MVSPAVAPRCCCALRGNREVMNSALLACSVGDIALLKRCLLSHTSPSATNKEGLNCLHLAAKNGHVDCLRYLLNNCSMDVNEAASPSGYTALHFSVSTKTTSLQCVELLLERGTDKNKQTKDGQTAIHLAARNGHVKCLKTLLKQGADINTTDRYGHSAYDVATLQGQFECARLLRALHWAERKDSELNSELQDRVTQQRQERERTVINSRLRKQAAERAYHQWAQTKSKTTHDPPFAYRERQEGRSTSRACSSCKTTTRTSSARQEPSNVRLTSPIKVTMHQKRRNVDSTGKPAKLHLYTNSLPQRKHKSSSKRTRSGCSSRATNTTQSPTPLCSKAYNAHEQQQASSEYNTEQDKDETTVDSVPPEATQNRDACGNMDSPTHECNPEEMSTVNTPQSFSPLTSQLNLGFLKRLPEKNTSETDAREPEEDTEVQFLIGDRYDRDDRDEEEEKEGEENFGEFEEDEDLAFHDVGGANSLNLWPNTLTKHHTRVELIKLLQYLGSNSSGSKFSHKRRRSVPTLQRRFSLGAIPEGQMVTNYSNESLTSHDEQKNRLRYIALSPRGSRVWEEEEETTVERAGVGDGTLQEAECEAEQLPDFGRPETEQDMSEPENKEDVVMSSATAEIDLRPLQTLNIVNFVWDASSKSVKTSVTKSPMIPMRPRSRPASAHPHSHSASSHSPSPATSSQQNMQRPVSASSLTPLNPTYPPRLLAAEHTQTHDSTPNPLMGCDSHNELESNEPIHQPPTRSPSPPRAQPQNSSVFAPHSLFSSSMSGIATKSMISLHSIPPSTDSTGTSILSQQELCHQPGMERRIKSAPNMLSLKPSTLSESQPQETM